MKARTWALAAMVVSCSFPNVTYDDGDSSTDATVDSASDADDATPPDASDEVDPCDKDHDGYRAIDGGCNGTDCDDNDPRVNPDAGMTFDVPDGSTAGDWNCDGKIDYAYPMLSCALTSCSAGFIAVVTCGLSGQWDNCSGLCNKTDAGTRTQGCQ